MWAESVRVSHLREQCPANWCTDIDQALIRPSVTSVSFSYRSRVCSAYYKQMRTAAKSHSIVSWKDLGRNLL